jgi:hypothetical protein
MIKEGIFIGPAVTHLFQDLDFKNKLNAANTRTWDAYDNACSNFLGNEKCENYVEITEELLSQFCALGCNM